MRAESLLWHGMLDMVVSYRLDLSRLARIRSRPLYYRPRE